MAFAWAVMAAQVVPVVNATAICAVGRAALQDLTAGNAVGSNDYYAGPSKDRRDVLDVCPDLKKSLPPGLPLADDDARARASVHVPVPGQVTQPAYIYSLDVPEIGTDGKSATVRLTYDCTGLCGGSFEYRYVLTDTGWHRDGAGRMLWVS